MTWLKLDDGYDEHPKILGAGPLAELLHVNSMLYAARRRTNGYIPTSALPRILNLDGIYELRDEGRLTPTPEPVLHGELVTRLIDRGLFEPAPGGFLIHDYLHYNPSRQQVEEEEEATQAARSAAGQKGGKTRAASGPRDDHGRYIGRRSDPDNSLVNPHKPTREPDPVPQPQPEPQSQNPRPSAAFAALDRNGNGNGQGERPTHDALYLAARINERWHVSRAGRLSPAGIQKFVSVYGAAAVEDALRELHGFPPEEAIRSPYAYLRAMLADRVKGVVAET